MFLQFTLLMWKNFMLQFRRPFGTLFETFAPILGMLMLVVLRFLTSTTENFCFRTFDATSLQYGSSILPPYIPQIIYSNCRFTYIYTPNLTEIHSIMQRTKDILSIPNLKIEMEPASNEQEIEKLALKYFSRISISDPSTNPYICQNILQQYG